MPGGGSAWAGERIPVAYRQVAAEFGIPPDVFYAVALTESGKASASGSTQRPWPWTLNIAGEGKYFESRIQAWRAFDQSLKSGESRIDVGLMQISWRYHRALLRSSWLALDPYRNLKFAAGILVACYEARGDWWSSVGCYHAPGDDERARRYRDRVAAHWRALGTSE